MQARRKMRDSIPHPRLSALAVALTVLLVPRPALAQTLGAFGRDDLAALALVAALAGFAVLTTIMLLKSRAGAAVRTSLLQEELRAAQIEIDRCRALLLAEPQILIAWRAGDDMPEIVGDTNLVLQSGPAQRLLAFGAWLPPEPALSLEHAIEALRDKGISFVMNLATSHGRAIEASGRAVGGQAVVRLRETTGVRRELAEVSMRQEIILDETENLRGLVNALPYPVWTRAANGKLAFANPAYAQAVEARDGPDAVARGLELADGNDRARMATALAQHGLFSERVAIVAAGERRIVDLRAAMSSRGSAGVAIDASEAVSLRAEVTRMTEAHRRTLDQLSTGVAIFDGRRQLNFYNDAYRRLWDLDPAWLDTRPDDTAVLDRLRVARRLPEEQDFRQWKARLHEAYRAVDTEEATWHLPDGRTLRVITTPNGEGGVTYLFDDVTERLALARRFDEMLRVQRETLDSLGDAVAVFGSNGCLRLYNPAFAKLWRIDSGALDAGPHITEVEAWCRALFDDDHVWQALRAVVTGIDNRNQRAERMERRDGSVLDCVTIPLPDGATLLAFQDVTDTVNVERALRERNEALETADQIKVDFVHNVSYELRSPLTTIIGFAHFLNDPSTGPLSDKQREYLGYITSSTNALLAIINNILDLATIDAGAMTLNLGSVDVRKAIGAAAEGIQDRLTRNHLALETDIDDSLGSFVADERRVVQVLYNLLANAAGFSPENGVITLTARRDADSVMLSVRDRGPGIPPDVKDRMFDWFESHAGGSEHRGAGLGLSLVRSFVELHGGHVSVDSTLGTGTTVSVSFPLDRDAHRTAAE